ncbi:MAG TPA: AAA family ATPase, partial [Acidimicrobiales bacterium]|nr:AAA family ATPase [Acidimicrobiales bacterium]
MTAEAIGRRAELAALTTAARQAVAGSGSVAIVEGDAGIGKTHLLGRFERDAGTLGMAVRRAAAQELERRRPFGSVFDALASHPGIDDIDRSATEFAIEEALLTLLDRTAAGSPVALVIDDLQWADPATIMLVPRLARLVTQLRLLLVLAVRPPLRPTDVSRLVVALRAAGARDVPVGPLTEDEVEAIVVDTVGAPPGPSLSKLLVRAGGSPLFVCQLLAGLQTAGALHVEDDGRVAADDVGMPSSLSAAILRRLDQLEPDTVEVLRLAAVLGTSFAVADLGAVSGRRAVD